MATSFVINKQFRTITNSIQNILIRQSYALHKLKANAFPKWHLNLYKNYNILLEPVNFNPVNPNRIRELYNGTFALGGKIMKCENRSPFSMKCPTKLFEEELYNFNWLNDLASSNAPIANAFTKSMIENWLDSYKSQQPLTAWRTDIVANRLTNLLSNCLYLLKGANSNFSKKLLTSISLHYRYTYATAKALPQNEQKLLSYLDLYLASLSLAIEDMQKKTIENRLCQSLKAQIFPDGGHISRNPQIMVDIILKLLAIRYSYNYVGKPILQEVHNAIERMIPALRMFVHKDKSLARFNGVGNILNEKINTIFTLDETKGKAFSYAPYSGYQRLEYEDTLLIADIGKCNDIYSSSNSAAGCLSFEFSSGKHCFVVNSGINHFAKKQHKYLGKLTVAHSTATINNLSSQDFIVKNENVIVGNNLNIEVEQIKGTQQSGFVARHDGYKDRYNVWHERKILLNCNGNVIQGSDRFIKDKPDFNLLKGSDQVYIRFHIHPDIEIKKWDMRDIYLCAPDGTTWCFTCDKVAINIEESIFFAHKDGVKKTQQLVLTFFPSIWPKINWMFQKIN